MTGDTRPSQAHPERCAIASDTDLSIAITSLRHWLLARGFDNGEAARIMTAASEIGRNILKYAGHGHLQFQSAYRDLKRGIEVSAIDQGPGIEDVEAAMRDRFSTSGTLGLGLPGVKRLVDEFEIRSAPGKGTRATFRLWHR
ncbi:MAG: anti-sigma regulatory factor [Thalassobaculaceae bacterium]